jgi:hypothetical protein
MRKGTLRKKKSGKRSQAKVGRFVCEFMKRTNHPTVSYNQQAALSLAHSYSHRKAS